MQHKDKALLKTYTKRFFFFFFCKTANVFAVANTYWWFKINTTWSFLELQKFKKKKIFFTEFLGWNAGALFVARDTNYYTKIGIGRGHWSHHIDPFVRYYRAGTKCQMNDKTNEGRVVKRK